MPSSKRSRWSTLLKLIPYLSAAASGLYYIWRMLSELRNGILDLTIAAGLFFAAAVALLLSVSGRRSKLRILRTLPRIAAVLAILILISVVPPAYACTRDTFCPTLVDGKPSVTQLTSRTRGQMGLGDEFRLDLDSGLMSDELPGVHRSIKAAAGDSLHFAICTDFIASPFLHVQPVLYQDNLEVVRYLARHIPPGLCESLSYEIPADVGAQPSDLDLYVYFALVSPSATDDVHWKGTLWISTADQVRTQSIAPPGPPLRPPSDPGQAPTPPALQIPKPEEPPASITPTSAPDPQTALAPIGAPCEPMKVVVDPGPADWWYVVEGDQTLDRLALLFYENPNDWPQIYSRNRSVIGDYGSMVPAVHTGQVIVIPQVQSPILHRVRLGDSLEGIAGEHYGLGAACTWRTVYDQNADVIGADPNMLNPGQVLSIFARVPPAPDQIWVLPDETISDIAVAFYIDERMKGWLCAQNDRARDGECDSLQALETLTLPDLPSARPHMVLPGDTWQQISMECYEDASPEHIVALQKGNRRIVGTDPSLLRKGQVLELRRCSSAPP